MSVIEVINKHDALGVQSWVENKHLRFLDHFNYSLCGLMSFCDLDRMEGGKNGTSTSRLARADSHKV
jgi:hypothetical protein